MGSPRRPERNQVPFLPMGYAGRLRVVYGAPVPDREHRHRVGGRELATQLHASYIDDEGRRAGHWKSPSQSVKAWSPLAVDSACPYRGNRESGRRDSSSRNREDQVEHESTVVTPHNTPTVRLRPPS